MSTSLSVSVTEDSYDIVSNTSVVKIVAKVKTTGDSHNLTGSAKLTVKVGGSALCSSKSVKFGYNSTTTIYTGTKTVSHNADGTGSCAWSVKLVTDISAGTLNKSGTKTLTTIPRTSSISLSSDNVTLGGQQKVSIASASSAFTHTIQYSLDGTNYVTLASGVASSYTWNLPYSLASDMGGSSASKTVTIRVTTYNGSTAVGSVTKTFTATVPQNESTLPTISNVVISDTASLPWDRLVQNLSDVNFSVSGSGKYGATITGVTIKVDGIIHTGNTSTPIVTKITGSGEVKYTVSVIDSRGFVTSEERTVTVYPYAEPKLDSANAKIISGNISATVTGVIYSVDNTNTKKVSVKYRNLTESSYYVKEYTLDNWNFSQTVQFAPSGIDINAPIEVLISVYDKYSSDERSIMLNAFLTMCHTDFGNTVVINTTNNVLYKDDSSLTYNMNPAFTYSGSPIEQLLYMGWGGYYSAVDTLNRLLELKVSNSTATIKVWDTFDSNADVMMCEAFYGAFAIDSNGKGKLIYPNGTRGANIPSDMLGSDTIVGCAGNRECIIAVSKAGKVFKYRNYAWTVSDDIPVINGVAIEENNFWRLKDLAPINDVKIHATAGKIHMLANTRLGYKLLATRVTSLR